mmetsp:Transcript_79259/g.229211  ORF Transcript_79259/g.229211 Transcript_79259/m.229211 type:complete len:371 (+) Transcript_79259:3445-4557(+)
MVLVGLHLEAQADEPQHPVESKEARGDGGLRDCEVLVLAESVGVPRAVAQTDQSAHQNEDLELVPHRCEEALPLLSDTTEHQLKHEDTQEGVAEWFRQHKQVLHELELPCGAPRHSRGIQEAIGDHGEEEEELGRPTVHEGLQAHRLLPCMLLDASPVVVGPDPIHVLLQASPASAQRGGDGDPVADGPEAERAVKHHDGHRDPVAVAAVLRQYRHEAGQRALLMRHPDKGALDHNYDQHRQDEGQQLVEQRPEELPALAHSGLHSDEYRKLGQVQRDQHCAGDENPLGQLEVVVACFSQRCDAQPDAIQQRHRSQQGLDRPRVQKRLDAFRACRLAELTAPYPREQSPSRRDAAAAFALPTHRGAEVLK